MQVLLLAAVLPATLVAQPPPRPVAAATIAPLADLTARVAGPGWDVRTVVPPGRSPHVFEPTPREVALIAPSRILVTAGAGYDDWIARLAEACASRATIHDMGASIGAEPAGAAGHDDHPETPHWWLSPPLAARALPPLAAALAALDPAEAEGYRRRAANEAAALERLDAELQARLAPAGGRSFLSVHAAWTVFAERYGLKSLGAIEPAPGREPTVRELGALIEAARRHGARVLFTEPQFPDSAARVLAREAGLRVERVDPIGGAGIAGRETYDGLMRYNAEAFRRGLGEKP